MKNSLMNEGERKNCRTDNKINITAFMWGVPVRASAQLHTHGRAKAIHSHEPPCLPQRIHRAQSEQPGADQSSLQQCSTQQDASHLAFCHLSLQTAHCTKHCPGLWQEVVLNGRLSSEALDYIRQIIIDPAIVYPCCLISINSSLGELARDSVPPSPCFFRICQKHDDLCVFQ